MFSKTFTIFSFDIIILSQKLQQKNSKLLTTRQSAQQIQKMLAAMSVTVGRVD